MRRTPIVAVTAAIISITLGACSGADAESSESATGGAHEPIVIYSNSVSDGRGEWLTDQASQAGFDIEYVDLGGADIANRLIAEKANPIADVVFGLNQVYFEKLLAADTIASYTPAWSELVGDTYRNPATDTYWPIVREPIMLVYDTADWTEQTAPTDWPDLWTDPQFDQQYEVQTTLVGATTQMVVTGILARYRDDSGELGISADGWDAIDQYFAHGSPMVQGVDLYARMADGEVSMGQMWLAGKATREAQYDITTEAVRPKVGVPTVAQSIAVVAGTKKIDTAQDFVDWFGSAEVQAAWSNEFFTAPVNEDALADANQDAVTMTDSFTVQDIDWPWVAENIDSWVEKIELDYLGQ